MLPGSEGDIRHKPPIGRTITITDVQLSQAAVKFLRMPGFLLLRSKYQGQVLEPSIHNALQHGVFLCRRYCV
jgi:hypothetical protein